jgi:hypothetical protein
MAKEVSLHGEMVRVILIKELNMEVSVKIVKKI